MKKEIKILIILSVLLLFSGGIYFFTRGPVNRTTSCTQEAKICMDGTAVGRTGPNCEFAACPVNTVADPLEKACLDAGGKVATSSCCKIAGDFPNLCLIGSCGCSFENSKEVKTCECGEGKCFDGTTCSGQSLKITIYCVNDNCTPQEIMAGAGTLIRGCYRNIDECTAALQTSKNENNKNEVNLPVGYTMDNYKVEKILPAVCARDSDCQTPAEYLMMSRCPFQSKCLNEKCTVVCPGHL